MRISIIGAGYVGLVAGACLAKLGNKVTLIDADNEKIEAISNRISPIYEEGLNEILNQVHIESTTDYGRIAGTDMIFLCVDTPVNDYGSICLEHITEATEQVAKVLREKRGYSVVVVKSTVVPGTTEELVIPTLQRAGKGAGKDFGVCMSPEFLREGEAVYDFMNPLRIIIG